MTWLQRHSVVVLGTGLVVLATITAAMGDGLTKTLAGRAAPGVVLFWIGVLVASFALLANRWSAGGLLAGSLRTGYPGHMAARAVLSVVSVASFFQAFASLQLAEVFIFIGLMPALAALFSAVLLQEFVSRAGWVALAVGGFGVSLLFPGGVQSIGWGHAMAFCGATSGTASLVLMRKISLHERNSFAQILYPHLALAVCALPFLPGSGALVDLADFALVALLAGLVLITRSLMVPAFARLRAHVASMLLNLQFIWMVLIGTVWFSETPGTSVFMGAALVVCAGVLLLGQQGLALRRKQIVTSPNPD